MVGAKPDPPPGYNREGGPRQRRIMGGWAPPPLVIMANPDRSGPPLVEAVRHARGWRHARWARVVAVTGSAVAWWWRGGGWWWWPRLW